jgi:uncharacterized protein (DUF1015 family)
VARLLPLRGVRFAADHVQFGSVLAPPYDVISSAQRERLYRRDLRNIVRIDYGQPYEGDVPGKDDVYTRAATHLASWRSLGILGDDDRPGFDVVAHDFATGGGESRRRLGLIGRVPALPWAESEVRPHERTLRGPKEDRLALMRTTRMQTSPVWMLWDRAPGLRRRLEELAATPPLLDGRFDGEAGSERVHVWHISDEAGMAEIAGLLAPASLFIADGHHRFETAAAYAAERRDAGDTADATSQFTLAYLSAADDPALVVLPIHRIVNPMAGLPTSREDLLRRLGDAWSSEPVDDPVAALAGLGARRAAEHTFVVIAPDGAAVLHRPRGSVASPRQTLDVVVLQEEVIRRCGIGDEALREGALSYARDPAEAVAAVREGRAGLAFLTCPCTSAQILAVAGAAETMPQKSTYFYPKVPTGLVLSPL